MTSWEKPPKTLEIMPIVNDSYVDKGAVHVRSWLRYSAYYSRFQTLFCTQSTYFSRDLDISIFLGPTI